MPPSRRGSWPCREKSRSRKVACGTARCISMDAVIKLATAVVGRLSNSSRVDRPTWPPCLASRKTQVLLLALRMLSGSVDMSRHEYVSELYAPATHSVSVRPQNERSRIQEASRSGSTSHTRLRKVPSEVTSGRGGRVERRMVGTTGRVCFVSIHIRPTVPRDPLPEV